MAKFFFARIFLLGARYRGAEARSIGSGEVALMESIQDHVTRIKWLKLRMSSKSLT
ncbi:unnamed protein product, partial [Larinioides sclopetarius]